MLEENDEKLIKIPLLVEDLSIEREFVLAKPLPNNEYILKSIPAFVYGVGYDDKVVVHDIDKGAFDVVKRGNNVSIRLFCRGSLDTKDIDGLIDAVVHSGGVYEIGKNTSKNKESSLLLISLPVSLGFPVIEKIMSSIDDGLCSWEYGNIYDKNGEAIGWWK